MYYLTIFYVSIYYVSWIINQTADKIANYTQDEKLKWSNGQRQLGNKLYSKQKYKEAMDVYLTCLVAINVNKTNNEKKNSPTTNDNDTTCKNDEWVQRTDTEIKLPILMNLSACTLKLGMHRKTCSFCDMALEINVVGSNNYTNPKIYFRRGKSYMLLGMHDKAERDYNKCLEILNGMKANSYENTMIRKETCDGEIEAVKKEMETLEKLKDAAEKNRIRHKKAMKMMLGGGGGGGDDKSMSKNHHYIIERDDTSKSNYGIQDEFCQEKASTEIPLYNEDENNTTKREFSTLRARRKKKKPIQKKANHETNQKKMVANGNTSPSTYFIWYMQKIEFGLRKILFWLGDEEAMTRTFDENEEKEL